MISTLTSNPNNHLPSSSHTQEPHHEDWTELKRMLSASNQIPAQLRNQIKEFVQSGHNFNSHSGGELALQGFDLTPHVAELVVAFLSLVQKKQRSMKISCLAIEHDIENAAALQILLDFLQNQHGDNIVDCMKLSFQSFGSSHRARQACKALLEARDDWRSIDLRCCNFCNQKQKKDSPMDMSFVTHGLARQTRLQSFTLSHGMDSGLPPLGGAELVETLQILEATQAHSLRKLVVRDWYEAEKRQKHPEQGQAVTRALIRLLGKCHRLETLIWDVPCTAGLYQDGSSMQRRLLAAIEHNDTLLMVQLRRLSIHSPLSVKVESILRRRNDRTTA